MSIHISKRLLSSWIIILGLSTFIQAQGGIYVMPENALDTYAPAIFTGANADNLPEWVTKNGGKVQKKDWIPGNHELLYVVYNYKLLEIWFGPYATDAEHSAALKKLYDLRNQPALKPYTDFIFVFPVILTPGEKIGYFNGPSFHDGVPTRIVAASEIDKIKKDVTEKLKQVDQADTKMLENLGKEMKNLALNKATAGKMDKLRDKHTDAEDRESTGKPGKSKKGNGLEGLFPASYSFSKWFAMTVDLLMDYFLPGVKSYVEKALVLAYMIMPEVVDRIASTLAKIQDQITPNNIDNALNQVADVVQFAYELYKDLQKLQNLMADPDFITLLSEVKLDKAVDILKKAGVPIGGCSFCGCFDIRNGQDFSENMGNCMKDKLKEEVLTQADKYLKRSGIPVLENLNTRAFNDLLKDKDWEKFTRTQTKSLVCPLVPAAYRNDCNAFVDGNYKPAIKSVIAKTIHDKTGVDVDRMAGVIETMEQRDYKKALKEAAKLIPVARYNELLGKNKATIDRLIDSGSEAEIRSTMEDFLKKTIDDGLLNSAVGSGAYLLERVVRGQELELDNGLRAALKRKYNLDPASIENLLSGKADSITSILKSGVKKMGITDPGALEAFAKGEYEHAMDLQIEFLKNQDFDQKGQVAYISQKTKNKKEMLNVFGEALKEELGDKDKVMQKIYEIQLQHQN